MIRSTSSTPIIKKPTTPPVGVTKVKTPDAKAEPSVAPQKESMEFTAGAALADLEPAQVSSKAVADKPEVTTEPRSAVESAPTTLLQEAAPLQETADAGPVTETQLITQAFESYQMSDVHIGNINETMGELSPEDQKAAGKDMFYHTASLMPQLKTQNEDGTVTGPPPAVVREAVSKMSPEDRAGFEGSVHQFMADDPSSAQIGVAGGAADFGRARLEAYEADAAAGKPVDDGALNQAATLYFSGLGYSEETGKFADSINGLFAMDKKDTAEAVLNATMFAQE